MSIIWDASKPAATSAIITQLTTNFIATDANGVKTIKREELRKFLIDQFTIVYTESIARPVDTLNIRDVFGDPPPDIDGMIDRLIAGYDVEDLKSTPAWPLTRAAQDKEELVNQVSRLQVAAQTAAVDIVNYYEDKVKDIRPAVEQWFAANVMNKKPDEPGGFPAGVDRVIDTRIYAATYVTNWDEESALGEPSEEITVDTNDIVVVTVPTAPSGYNINRVRLYRSSTGTGGTAFQFVKEQAVASGYAITDDVPGTMLGETCPTLTWRPPPAQDTNLHPSPKYVADQKNLQGLVGMPNGIMAGFFDQTLCFCEAYHPYAWPTEYRIPLEFPIVGLGVFGQTVFVGTRGNPYLVSGADPGSMSAIKLETNQACVSKRSIASVGNGVVYASPDGLCMADGSGVRLVTEKAFTRSAWQALVPTSIFGIEHEGVYYAFYNTGSVQGCYTFDLVSGNISTLGVTASAAYVDRVTDTLYVASGTNLLAVYGGGTPRTGTWRSKIFRLAQEHSFGWLHVDASFAAPVTVRFFVNGNSTPWYTATVSGPNPVRLPPGRYQEWQLEVESTAPVTSVVIASETSELQHA